MPVMRAFFIFSGSLGPGRVPLRAAVRSVRRSVFVPANVRHNCEMLHTVSGKLRPRPLPPAPSGAARAVSRLAECPPRRRFLRTLPSVFPIGGFRFSIGGFEFSIGGFGFPVGGFGAPLRGNAQKNCRSGWKSPLRQLCLAGFRIPRRRGGCPLRSAVSVRPRARGAARSPACRSPLGLCLKRCRGRPKGVLRRWHWACPAWPPPRG